MKELVKGVKLKSINNPIVELAVNSGVFGIHKEPITLKSGRKSRLYINWRKAAEDVFLMDQLSDFIAHSLHEKGVDTIVGVAEGATKIGLLTQLKLARLSKKYQKGSHVLSMIRGKIKEHGSPSDKYLLGVPKGKVALIEDVTTTGGSLLDAVKMLKEINGIEVECVFVLTNRDEKVKALIENTYHIPFFALSTAGEMAEYAFNQNEYSEEFMNLVKEELR